MYSLERLLKLLLYFGFFLGNGHHWKGLYVESMQEALYRGFKVRAGDMADVCTVSSIFVVTCNPIIKTLFCHDLADITLLFSALSSTSRTCAYL